jgi:hypothetical protein
VLLLASQTNRPLSLIERSGRYLGTLARGTETRPEKGHPRSGRRGALASSRRHARSGPWPRPSGSEATGGAWTSPSRPPRRSTSGPLRASPSFAAGPRRGGPGAFKLVVEEALEVVGLVGSPPGSHLRGSLLPSSRGLQQGIAELDGLRDGFPGVGRLADVAEVLSCLFIAGRGTRLGGGRLVGTGRGTRLGGTIRDPLCFEAAGTQQAA